MIYIKVEILQGNIIKYRLNYKFGLSILTHSQNWSFLFKVIQFWSLHRVVEFKIGDVAF